VVIVRGIVGWNIECPLGQRMPTSLVGYLDQAQLPCFTLIIRVALLVAVCVMLCIRFPLRNVEDLLQARGINVCMNQSVPVAV